MKKAVFILHLVLSLTVLSIEKLYAQNYVPFTIRYQETVKGDMLLVGNSILNVGTTRPANNPYTGTWGYNSGIDLQYADVDNDASTFNSSSAEVKSPNVQVSCLRIKKAYLYWSAAYTQERENNQTNPRLDRSKFGQVKFKTPNSAYQSLTGTLVYDRNDIIVSPRPNAVDAQRAYVYMADVTSLLETEASGRNGAFDGNYTVADLMAPYGKENSGVGYAAGWTLVVIYEDLAQPSRHITLFDGFSVLNTENKNIDIPITGFQTIPSGSVNAKFAFAALVGELGIYGDALRIKTPSNPTGLLIDVSQRNSSSSTNFFNSKITDLVGENLNRNPASTNLLGFDAGILQIPNAGNTLIANNSTSATINPTTDNDAYYPFMMAFNVEVIAPVIDLEKRVQKATGEDITGGGSANLGETLRYYINFRNSGNDDARDLVITDKLPKNVIFKGVSVPSAMSAADWDYDATAHSLTFRIPNSIVKKGQTNWDKIVIEVQVPAHCDDLRDACSNEISNVVHAKYFGVQNTSADGFIAESVSQHRDCEGNITGETIFIADLGTCVSKAIENLCERTLTLTAGANFDTYTWYRNGTLISGANAQTLTVSETGLYRVEKKKAGCADMVEEIDVKLHDVIQTNNPIEQYASETVICESDGTRYPQIYLCGTSSSKNLVLNVTQALSYKWERRNESCTVPPNHSINCPVRENYGCTWQQVHTGSSYNVSVPGDYRVEVAYQGGCVALYYFKVTKIELTPNVDRRHIICNQQGRITITHPTAGYEYALTNGSGTVIRPYQDSNIFDNITTPDAYKVLLRQKLAVGATYSACVFEVEASITTRTPQIEVTSTPLYCVNTKGTLRVRVTDAYSPYTYTVRRNNATGSEVAAATATNTSDITFSGLDDGTYHVTVTTPDGCSLTDTETITKAPELKATMTVASHLMCNGQGIVRVDIQGGTPQASNGYAISLDGATYVYTYANSHYEFTVSSPKTYTVRVVDANNCEVTETSPAVRQAVAPTFNIQEKLTDCGTKGTIEFINVTNPEGYILRYSIDGGATSQIGTKFFGLTPDTTYTPTLIYSTGAANCTITSTVTLPPEASGRVIASAGVAQLIGCGEGANIDKAQVRITNVRGGTPPYEYSFDGGATWTNTREMWLLPGTYTVIARDQVDCEFRTTVQVEDRPVNPIFTPVITYNCDGTGNVVINSSQSTYSYTYTFGGVTTTTSSFQNLPPGRHLVRVSYADPSTPSRHELFIEDFGVGTTNVRTPYMNPVYFFEPQSRDITLYPDDLQVIAGGGVRILNNLSPRQPQPTSYSWYNSTQLNDGEYVVSRRLNPNNPAWHYPVDHTGLTNGRMLLVNVGDILGNAGAILYQREMNDVMPNQPIRFSIAMFNLINASGTNPGAADPNLTIELYTSEAAIAANTPLISQHIGSPPKSTSPNDWHTYAYELNPGNNTKLYAVIRSGSLVLNGNDLAVDDIYLYQLPKICSFDETVEVIIEPDKAFGVLPHTTVDITCNNADNGEFRAGLRNIATTGYWVSKDGGAFTLETANPFVWTGINGGTHTVVLRYGQDTANCEVTRTFTINNPSAITIAPIADLPLGCNPASVNVTVSATGGVGALRYQITEPDGTVRPQNSVNFTLTKVGSHQLTVTDANGCQETLSFNVTPVSTPALSAENTSNYCVSAGTLANIDVSVTGGTPPFTYAINGSVRQTTNNTTYIFAGLQPGTYTMTVTDSYGCVGTLVETIQPELRINGATVEKDITCDAAPNDRGRIKVTITGGYAPFTYIVVKDGVTEVVASTTVPTNNEIIFESNEAGAYTIKITDSKNCTAEETRTLTAPEMPTLTYNKTDVNCYGESTGAIVITTTGGVAPYRYFLNGTDRGTQNTFNNLAAGVYTVTVRDTKNCVATETVTITQPDAPLAINTFIKQLISCDPTQDKAVVEYSVAGGTPTYNDNQGGTSYGTETRTISLGVGTHNLTVTDAKGCQTQTTIVVPSRPAPPTVSPNPVITYNCDGTGNFTLTPTPATYSYTFTLGTESNTTGTFNNVPVGTHPITIHYVQNNIGGTLDCGYTMTITVVVEPNKEFRANVVSVKNVSCAGGNDGQITLNVENFGAGYAYSIDGGASISGSSATLQTPATLTAGLHTITLTLDSCTVTVTATVTEPKALVVTPTITVPAQCNNNQRATISLQASEGTAPYRYSLNGGTPQTGSVFTQVPVGTHTFTVIDGNNCQTSVSVEVEAPKAIVFTAVPTACYSGNNDAEIVVTVTDGNGGYRFSINNGAWQTPAATSSLTYTFTNLPASATGHLIRVEDSFGCQATTTVVIYPRLVVTTKETALSCKNGSIEITAIGGDGSYQYAVVPQGGTPAYGSANTYPITTAGTYDVYVQSAACVYSTTVTVGQATPVAFTATAKQPNCHGYTGNIELTNIVGDGPYTLNLYDSTTPATAISTVSNYINTSYDFSNLAADKTYFVTVTDRYGCVATETVTLTDKPQLTATITLGTTGCVIAGQTVTLTLTVSQDLINAYQALGYTVEYSTGGTWTAITATQTTIFGFRVGDDFVPSLRVVNAANNIICLETLPRYTVPFPLSELAVATNLESDFGLTCTPGGFTVRVTASGGVSPYTFTMDNPNGTTPPVWLSSNVSGNPDQYLFTGLTPGRTYVFYVKDNTGCIQQNEHDIYEGYIAPVSVVGNVTPICYGQTQGSISFVISRTLSSTTTATQFDWVLINKTTSTTVTNGTGAMPAAGSSVNLPVNNLPLGTYYLVITEQGTGCQWASADVEVYEQTELQGTPVKKRDVTCALPGLIEIEFPHGGGGSYTYHVRDITGTTFTTTNTIIEIPVSSLPSGVTSSTTYRITMVDQYGCDKYLGEVTMGVEGTAPKPTAVPNSCVEPLSVTATYAAVTGRNYEFAIRQVGGAWSVPQLNNPVFTNLTGGVQYEVKLQDMTTGCEAISDPVTLHPKLQADVQQTKLLGCDAANTAEITINVTAGSGTYEYEVSGAASIAKQSLPTNPYTFVASTAGTYTVNVYDGSTTCPPLTYTITVAAPVYPAFTASTVSVTCHGGNDGMILIQEINTGAPTVTYTLSGGPTAATYNAAIKGFDNLQAGFYTITALSANGCATNTTVQVREPAQVSVNSGFVTVTQFACTSGNSPESAIVTLDPTKVTGGIAPYSFTITYNTQTVSGTTLTTTDHSGGLVNITITDANGCSTQTSTTITQFDALTDIYINPITSISCQQGEELDVVVTSVRNNPLKLEFAMQTATITTLNWETSPTVGKRYSGLAPGSYVFWVRHTETGCMTSTTHVVKEPNTFVIDPPTITPVVCKGGYGTVVFNIHDTTYTGQYNYSVLGTTVSASRIGSGTVTFTIQAGTYTFTVTQASRPSCTNEYVFTVTEPDVALTATLRTQSITCALNDGVIEVINTQGGWGNYQYRITPGTGTWTTTPIFTGLTQATYSVEVRDKEGCVVTLTTTLSDPAPLTATLAVDTHNCVEGTGVLRATASGGEGTNYTFQLIKGGTTYGAPVATTNTTTVTFGNLSSGAYQVQVSDTWGCIYTLTTAITLYEPITNPSVKIDKEITCTSPTGASVTIQHQGGNSGNITYVVTPPTGAAITQTNNPVFTNLTAVGTYNVTITDNQTGCPAVTTTFELTDVVNVAFTHSQTNVSCNGGNDGSIAVSLDNTQTQLNYQITLTSAVAGFTTQSQTVSAVPSTHYFNGLAAGVYTVTVTSARGCMATQTIVITQPNVLAATASVTVAFACDASNIPQQAVIQATVTGGTAPFNYSIDGSNFANTTGTFTITDTGAVQNITVTVRDAKGCEVTTLVAVNPLPKITAVALAQGAALTCANDETVNITITGGGANGFQIDARSATVTPTVAPTTQTLPAGTNTATFNMSAPGQYTFVVTDLETGCYTTVTYVVNPFVEMQLTATPNKMVSCYGSADGEIKIGTVSYTGSYTWEVLDAATLASLTPAKTGTVNAPVFGTPVETIINGLPAGQYVVKVVQAATPFCTLTSTVVQIAQPTAALTVTSTLANPLTCLGNDAVISAQAQGGWGDYQYRLDRNGTPHPTYGTYSTSETFANLNAGTYVIWAKDKEGCETSTTVVLTDPTAITVNITPSVTSLVCFGDRTATITASATGGSGNYKYILITRTASGTIESGAQDTPVFTGLGAGEYAVKVVDGWNCDNQSAFITITQPTQVRVEASITQRLTCLQNAQITVTATGGSGTGYVFTVASSTGTINSLGGGVYSVTPGTYAFTAVDSNGCPSGISNIIEILPLENLGLTIDTTDAFVKCNGDSSATIKAVAYGALGDYRYELLNASGTSFTPPVTNTDGVFGGLATGTYYVKVTSDDCEHTSAAIIINEAPAFVFTTATSTNETCYGEKDGTITVQASGGTGAITYAISPRLDRVVTAEYINNQKFEPGTYTVIAQDANGCTLEHQFVIAAATQINVTLVSKTDETCFGNADGTATITVTGGVPPYSTILDTDYAAGTNWVQGKFFYDNLPARDNITIFVKDANNCEAYVIIPRIAPGVDLQVSAEAQPQCNNNNVIDNRIVVSVNPLYASQVTYSLNGGTSQRTNVFSGVVAGTHTITVAHPNGCVQTVTVEMPNYSPLSVVTSTTEITCNGANDGTISLQVTGGTSSYTYTITPVAGNFDATTGQYTNLPPNNYTVVIRDNVLGCVITEQFRFTNPDLLYVDARTVTETCYGDNDGQIIFEIKGGRPTYSYVLTNSQGQQIAANNGIAAAQVITHNGLTPGEYLLTYVDAGGVCTQTHTLVVGAAPNLKPVSIEVKYDCGTNVPANRLEVVFDNMLMNHSNVFYALNSTNIIDARRFTEFNGNIGIVRNLPAGSDQFITIFHNSCSYTIPMSDYFDVDDYDALTLQNISDPQQMNQVKVRAEGGKPSYTYYFNGKLSDDGDTYYVSAYDPGYTDANGRIIKQIEVMVVDDLGCTRTITVEKEFIDIHIPNYFTPNGDGNNDGWSPRNTRSYPNIETIIYDRYGRLITKLRQGEEWDGKYNGRDLPTGDYWYLVKLNEDRDDSREFIGNFTLFR